MKKLTIRNTQITIGLKIEHKAISGAFLASFRINDLLLLLLARNLLSPIWAIFGLFSLVVEEVRYLVNDIRLAWGYTKAVAGIWAKAWAFGLGVCL